MSRRVGAAILALGLLAIAGALVAVFALRGDPAGSRSPDEPIAVSTAVSPRIAFFGDTITARVDATVDGNEVDPELVEIKGSFAPWTQVSEPLRARLSTGSTTYLRTTFTLRCLNSLCLPSPGRAARFDFKPARVSYEAPTSAGNERLTVSAQWAPLFVHSRFDAASFSERDPLAAPWRADLTALPAVTYHVAPGGLVVLLLVAGVLLVAVAGVLAYRMLPHRREPAPSPPPEPEPVVSPLEQALVLLETPAAEDGIADRRRALELVADEVAGWGDRKLEHAAKALAWSEDVPASEATSALAATVRARLKEGLNGRPA
jgi:hypothetical protein